MGYWKTVGTVTDSQKHKSDGGNYSAEIRAYPDDERWEAEIWTRLGRPPERFIDYYHLDVTPNNSQRAKATYSHPLKSGTIILSPSLQIIPRTNELKNQEIEFTIKIEEYVSTPAQTPTSISVTPSPVKEGEAISISWGTSAYATKYYLQRSINSGSYTNIYNGTTRSYSDTALSTWNTVTYRVRGYNSDGYSSYKTSSSITVTHNVAPTTPSSISVPSLRSGSSSTISWGASTDADGDSISYRLERSINGGSYSQIYSGSSRSTSDTPLASWSTVAYRVRAYDGTDYSSYKTSSSITVIHFPELKMRVSGALKTSDNGWVRVNGVLKEIDSIWVRVSGTLKEV